MKRQILKIADELANDVITTEQAKNLLLVLFDVSHSTSYLDDKYEVKWLINNTYQVEQNGHCVYQGTESDCNEWLKCQLGYCGSRAELLSTKLNLEQ